MNIYDIADKAGVSIATVSRVLNDSEKVSEKTRNRILNVIEEEGYVPNAFARGLGLNTMRMVGVMCTDITDPFYAGAVGIIERLLRANGMDTVLSCTGNDISNKKKALEALVNRKVDAVILIGSALREKSDNTHIRSASKTLPIVIINGYISAKGVYCILCDERKAVKRTVQSLNAEGLKNILYLYNADTYSGLEKRGGYEDGCDSLGLTKLCRKIEKKFDAAEEATLQALENEKIDAIITSEDLLAAGALKALRKKNVSMPVVGFNNSVISECTAPTLTSIDNKCESMCEIAVKLLSDIGEGKSVPQKTVLSASIALRESFNTDNWQL